MNGGTSLRTRVAALATITITTIAVVAFGSQAGAGVGGAEAISVAPSTVSAGNDITITGAGWFCQADVDVFIDDAGSVTPVASIAFDDLVDGGFVVTITAPNDAGDYDVIAEYGANQTSSDCDGVASDPFTVATTTTTTMAPSTSSSTTTTTTMPASSSTTTTTEVGSDSPTTTTTTTTIAAGGGPTTVAGSVSTLPATGGSGNGVVAYALVALALGALLVILSRRTTAS